MIPLFSQGLNKKAEFKAEKTEFNDKVIIYNNKQYKNIDELIKEVEKDANIFYSIVYFIVKIVEDGSYKKLLKKEDIEILKYYLKKLNSVELAVSLFISEKNREFNLYGIKLNQNKLVEICKKYLDSSDLNELTAQELNIIKLIKNYYFKKIDDYNIFDVYEISKEKDIGLNKIFEIIKRIELDTSKIDYIFPFIISLIEVDGFYKLIYERRFIHNRNYFELSDIVGFIIKNGKEIFKYWFKVLGKEKLKNILYNSSKEDITDFLISKVFSKEELKEILYEAIEAKKENITEFLVSKVFSKEELKQILYESIEGNRKNIVDFLVFKVFNKQEMQEIFDEFLNKGKLKTITFLIFNVFDNNKIEELFNKDILDKLVKIKDEYNRTILHYAVLKNRIDLVKFLLSNYEKRIDVDLVYMFHDLIKTNNEEMIKFVLSKYE